MSAAATPPSSPWETYKRLMRYARPHWPVFLIAFIGMAVLSATDTGLVAMQKPLIDEVFVARDPVYIRWMPWLIIALFVARGLAIFASNYGMAWVGRRVVQDLRQDFFESLLKKPSAFYDQRSSGELIARLTFHVEQVAEAISNAIMSLIKDGAMVIFLIAHMIWLDWKLTTFILVVGPMIALLINYVSRRFRLISRRIQDSMGDVTHAAEEVVLGQRVIKIFGGQQFEKRSFSVLNNRNRQLFLKLVVTRVGSTATVQFIGAWALAGVIYFATIPSMIEQITPGTFVAYIGSMLALLNPLKSLTTVQERLQRGVAAAADVFGLMDEPAEPVGGGRHIERAQGALKFEAVQFRYPGTEKPVLSDVSLSVQAGQTVAFVGRSGSGKSTLLSLIPRFHDPDSGEVCLDGAPLDAFELSDLRRQIALVDQQVRLFNATVAENIAYGMEPAPSREQIQQAAEDAYAWDFIKQLPQGLDTPIGQNGASLSGGQRQRLAIARALLKDAPILLLDEATSALDTESERYIQAALDRLVQGRTTLVIAHRLSTIQGADLIVVMDQGRVVEQGTHAELLAADGVYAALHRMQFEDAGPAALD